MRDTIDMARESGFTDGELAFMGDNFRRFADLVRADEREACAKVCDDYDVKYDVCSSDTAESIATAIRSRGENT
jgi:hypothetical protein